FTVNNTPVTPALTVPGPGEFTLPSPTLTWSAAGQKSDVTYTVALDDTVVSTGQKSTTYAVATPLADGAHGWHVDAVGCKGATASSGADRQFHVDGTP